ncbi:MAG TPA: phosphopantetheine-binding protein [Streptomyces sp.]|uniref:phosphopantetheine-binding protein n=1 Tax=Streptomyces sp. TaxID=1931 RepID=UPI002CE202D4|nr:phosphopantetheine-binding protein [Streptomyces sp.]HWU10946.1 phosphopantetheine-binding protein [Streptomyces sp.]
MLALLVGTLTDHFGKTAGAFGPGTRLEELEVDSIAMLELLTILEDDHNLHMPDDITALRDNPTLSEVADFLQSVQPATAPAAGAVKATAV